MRMPDTLFAILLGLLALYALFTAGGALRRKGAEPNRAAMGWALVAIGAAVQIVFLVRQPYSVAVSIITTILILAGGWLTRTSAPATSA